MTGLGFVFTLLITSASADVAGHANLTCNFHAFGEEQRKEFESIVVEGYYSHGFEKMIFRPIESEKAWWVFSYELNELLKSSKKPILRVKIRGMLSPIGKYGHGLDYERCLTEVEVLKVVGPDDSNCDEQAKPD